MGRHWEEIGNLLQRKEVKVPGEKTGAFIEKKNLWRLILLVQLFGYTI
jgi:hypothetical protein